MRAMIFDIVITAAVLLIGAGVTGRWGWPEGCMVVGALVLALAFLEVRLLRRGG